ncbi:carbohydrate porin [Massilia dura]|uniref:Carbohydrate porin n=1 Tax=Pseudoduganella dura TaxID=321982 RepID=A0A6I3XHX2_9BURK|nr:carbohydrate porin [Pseudoduganella dura]MUI13993.1 carbohydrate porin [Pseudoduganella dura]GGX91778.1 maltoporin [Pseudoduganella dura]
MIRQFAAKPVGAALALAFACATAAASDHDTEGFHGYLRAGIGNSNHGGTQSCYGLGGITTTYRLGNECDSFTELGYTQEVAKAANGATFVATVWATAFKNSSDFGDAKVDLAKAYIEARNLPFLNGGTAWAGKRYYMRPDVHMLDLQYINLNGTGAGIDRYPLGPGKASYAIFKDNDFNTLDPATGRTIDSPSATRHVFLYEGLPANAGGTLDIAASLIAAEGEDESTHNGWQLSVFHRQRQVMDGTNTLGVQYGAGPGTGIDGPCCARIGSAGSTLLGSDYTRLRIFDELYLQPTRDFGIVFVALHQRDRNGPNGSATWNTLGTRPSYALADNFKLQAELGVTTLKSATTPGTQRLTKLTIAPTIALARDYWSRPELRLFATYGKWNDAATAAVNAFNNSGAVYGTDTSGFSYGVHLEAWW